MKRFRLSIVSLLVMCVVLEVVLRTTHLFHARLSWTEPDREIGWRFTPGRDYWFYGENDHAITGRINSMGWRDKERTKEKPAHTYRIAVLGDSYVEAFQVEQDSTFCAMAEQRLNAASPGRQYEVMNFGRSGMCPTEESIVLERDILPCAPDEVVLLFTPHNDIADVKRATAADVDRPFLEPVRDRSDLITIDKSFVSSRGFRVREAINPLKQHSALVSLIIERYNAWRLARTQKRVAPRDETRLTREQRLCTAHPDSVYVANYALCKFLMVGMAGLCHARGIHFALAAVPLTYAASDVARAQDIDSSFDPAFFDRDLGALADSTGFSFLPMTAPFAARSRAGVGLQWRHWSYRGHEVAAQVLFDRLWAPPGRVEKH